MLGKDGFHIVQRDAVWLMVITVLADVAAMVGTPEHIKALYELLRPIPHLSAVAPTSTSDPCLGTSAISLLPSLASTRLLYSFRTRPKRMTG